MLRKIASKEKKHVKDPTGRDAKCEGFESVGKPKSELKHISWLSDEDEVVIYEFEPVSHNF